VPFLKINYRDGFQNRPVSLIHFLFLLIRLAIMITGFTTQLRNCIVRFRFILSFVLLFPGG
jgi:hypothetical protein